MCALNLTDGVKSKFFSVRRNMCVCVCQSVSIYNTCAVCVQSQSSVCLSVCDVHIFVHV